MIAFAGHEYEGMLSVGADCGLEGVKWMTKAQKCLIGDSLQINSTQRKVTRLVTIGADSFPTHLFKGGQLPRYRFLISYHT